MAKLYSAYKAAGEKGGAYASSLQDIMNIGYEKEHSKQMFDIGQEISDRKFGVGQQALGLIGTAAGIGVAQEEAAADIKSAYGDKAEQTYGEAGWLDIFKSDKEAGRAKGETRFGELQEKLNVLFGGKEREWTLEDDIGGLKAGVHRQSNILSESLIKTYGED